MLPAEPEFAPPVTVTLLRVFGSGCCVGAAGVAYAALECAALVPLGTAAYAGLSGLLLLLPLSAGVVAFGLASVAESAARTAWELRIRRR